jgi:hypothetical protein
VDDIGTAATLQAARYIGGMWRGEILDLTAVRAEIENSANPDLVWTAIFTHFASRPDARETITTVIDRHRDNDGAWKPVRLPRAARNLFT